ncbi:MAG: cysteine--tRNA ligase [Gammaproteobacteria bacterium]
MRLSLTLYNSFTRQKEPFVPQDISRVTMYACGPTVYNPPHIGNARAAVVYDLLYRVLMRHYANVVYARNITDVDDKINAQALAEQVPIEVITNRYIDVYHRDMEALGVLPPVIEPRATAHIEHIIKMIQNLIDKSHAYEADGHVLFDVTSFADYGKLAGRSRDDMIAGARVEVAPYKRDPADFVLWKPSSTELPGWDSPWGRGRPGWHIECSAMAEAHLGTTIDIHGGGNDLKFPHHENEIAQSTCAHDGKTFARYWVHNGFVQMDKQKMSKSIGNILLVKDLLTQFPGEAIRMALLKAKYREPLNWDHELIQQAKAQLDRLYGALERLEDVEPDLSALPHDDFVSAMDDDLNTPAAIAVLMDIANHANKASDPATKNQLKSQLLAAGRELGLLEQSAAEWFAFDPSGEIDKDTVERLIAERNQARRDKNWSRADEIRDELTGMGVQIKDSRDGTEWRIE